MKMKDTEIREYQLIFLVSAVRKHVQHQSLRRFYLKAEDLIIVEMLLFKFRNKTLCQKRP